MRILLLALRNLRRNIRRSLMTLFAMVIGLVSVLLFGGFIQDIRYGLQTNYVRTSGHLQIQHDGYFVFGSGNPAAYGIHDYEHILAVVRNDPVLVPMLVVATPTLQFGGIAGNFSAGVSRTVFANGAIAGDQALMRNWNEYRQRRSAQRVSLAGSPDDNVLIGVGVARVLQLCAKLKLPDCESAPVATAAVAAPDLPDDISVLANSQAPSEAADSATRIEMLASNSHGAPNVAALRVLTAQFQGVKELDDVYMALHLSQAQRLLFGADHPQVTAVALQLQHTWQQPAARARLQQLLDTTLKGDDPLTIVDFETLNPFYGQTMSMFNAIFGFISILIGGIVLFTVGNTMSMAVIERTSEVGTLRAIGHRRGAIRSMFVIEGLVLGLLGAFAGMLCAVLAAAVINHMGLTWLPPSASELQPLAVSVAGEYQLMIPASIGLVIVAAMSATLPAIRAARMNIVDALRHV